MFRKTLSILWILVELFALARAAIATYTLVYAVTGSQLYTIFTLLVIEGLFLCALFLMRVEAVAPIAALLALAFSSVAQYYELRLMAGTLTEGEREILNYVIAFAPSVVLALAYIRHLVGGWGAKDSPLRDLAERIQQATQPKPVSAERGSKRGG
jgi:hypothetical protein